MTHEHPDSPSLTDQESAGAPRQTPEPSMSSNRNQRSNFESNYPDGTASSSGLDESGAELHEMGKPTPHHEDQYGPSPPRDQIRPPEMDIAVSAEADEGVPDSVTARSDAEEYARHFGVLPDSPAPPLSRPD